MSGAKETGAGGGGMSRGESERVRSHEGPRGVWPNKYRNIQASFSNSISHLR